MAVKLNMKAQPVFGDVSGCPNMIPGPWACVTPLRRENQMRIREVDVGWRERTR